MAPLEPIFLRVPPVAPPGGIPPIARRPARQAVVVKFAGVGDMNNKHLLLRTLAAIAVGLVVTTTSPTAMAASVRSSRCLLFMSPTPANFTTTACLAGRRAIGGMPPGGATGGTRRKMGSSGAMAQ